MRNFVRHSSLSIVLAGLAACGHGDRNRVSDPAAQPPETNRSAVGGVDLQLHDTDLLDALGALAGKGGINIFADSDVNEAGPVNMSVHAASASEVLAQIASDHQLRVEKLEVRGTKNPAYWVSRQASEAAPVTSFTGERITARFDEVPIRDVAKTLSDVAGTPIVVDDAVQANITLHLRLPWDLALYHLAQKYELRIVRGDHELRITRRE
ncbi:MAG: hypothetical protein AB7O24_04565 [Kofleriaceae bacterium]